MTGPEVRMINPDDPENPLTVRKSYLPYLLDDARYRQSNDRLARFNTRRSENVHIQKLDFIKLGDFVIFKSLGVRFLGGAINFVRPGKTKREIKFPGQTLSLTANKTTKYLLTPSYHIGSNGELFKLSKP